MSGNWSTTHAKITHTQSVPCILMLVHNLLPLSLVVVKDSLIEHDFVSLFVSVSTMTQDIHGWIFMPLADNRMRGGSMFSTCPAVCACVCVCVRACVCVLYGHAGFSGQLAVGLLGQQQQPPFYSHCTGHPALASTSRVKNWRIFWFKVLLPACPCWRQPAHTN